MINNPILPGFNPDPSAIRVGDDFYVATSTFEWFPGVSIYHSKDLANWNLVTRPLDRASQLDMRGNPDSCGVWAPAISYSDGIFWLTYTDVKRYDGNFKDTHNYLVTAENITGPWSDPVYLNSSGFDPSLFHDGEKKWLLNMFWDYRATPTFFGGILLQEYDVQSQKLVGKVKNIFKGSKHGFTEGPHLYRKNGYYYLVTAEGGTGYNHGITMARSRTIDGPYELHPKEQIVTSKDAPDCLLQRSGHGQFLEAADGTPYVFHLCSRPLPGTQLSPLGRETSIQKARWQDDWLYLSHDSNVPQDAIASLNSAPSFKQEKSVRYTFETEILHNDFQWLRTPFPERIFSLRQNPGSLTLIGRESIGSFFEQSLVARRQDTFNYTAQTAVQFSPENSQQMAGITCYYNQHKFHYMYLTWQEGKGCVLQIMSCEGDYPEARLNFPLEETISIPAKKTVFLRGDVGGADLQFSYSLDGKKWITLSPVLDNSLLSDEAGRGMHANFTGAFVGMACQDVSGGAKTAEFEYFEYIRHS